ncbi:MAG: cysteine desulfurase family protein [Saprospiraceae bacterium]
MKERIYLDHASTTPVAPTVLTAILPHFTQQFGNASSRSHSFGWEAEQAVKDARVALAELLEVNPTELTFTSGSTEAINLAINGIAKNYAVEDCHLITTTNEHSAVLETHETLENIGYSVTYLNSQADGTIDLSELVDAIQPNTRLVSVLWANNETGVLQDMEAIGALCKRKSLLLFADATQVVGKIQCHPKSIGVHALALSAHKFYGPKGVGALWHSSAAPRVVIRPQFTGGSQQTGLRPGTLNTPGIVGLGASAILAQEEMLTNANRLKDLRDYLERELSARLEEVLINGQSASRLPHISNLSFRFTEAEALMSTFQRRLALSTGSACSSADLAPSHVLLAMGLSKEDAKSSLRISLGRDTNKEEITIAIDLIEKGVNELRAESPTWELFQDGILS